MALDFSLRSSGPFTLSAGQLDAGTANWKLFAAADATVTRRRAGAITTLILGVDYIVTGVLVDAGFSVTLTQGAEEGDEISILGARQVARKSTISDDRATTPSLLNIDLDIAYAQMQEMHRLVANALSISAVGDDFDARGNKITNVADAENPGDAVNFSQLEAIVAGTISDFNLSGLDPIPAIDGAADLLMIWDESAEKLCNTSVDSLGYVRGPTPGASTDGAIAVWNGTLGRTLKNTLAGIAAVGAGALLSLANVTALYVPDPATFVSSSIFVGTGGRSLAHTANLEGYYNTGVGIRCLTDITTGSYNTGMGYETLERITTGRYNTALGEASMIYHVTSELNTALGWKAFLGDPNNNTIGQENTIIGASSAINAAGAPGYNCSLGAYSLFSVTGNGNVAVGHSAGYDILGGTFNVCVGYFAGKGITTGSYNTIIGPNLTGLSGALANTLIIGAGNNAGAGVVRIAADDTSVRLMFGTRNLFQAITNGAAPDYGTFTPGTGGVTMAAAGTSTDIGFVVRAKGVGAVTLGSSAQPTAFTVAGVASGVNYMAVSGAATATAVTMQTAGSDTDISMTLTAKGAGGVNIGNGNQPSCLVVVGTPSGANFLAISGDVAGGLPSITATGSDTTVDMLLQGKGGGTIVVPSLNSGHLAGMRNVIMNGCMRINQRLAATNADDTFGFDRWNVLTQSNAIAVSQLTLVEDGTPFMQRLTQSNASAQRFGIMQMVEVSNSYHLRSRKVTLSARVRCSASTTLRYAVLEWTGTSDTITSDVVNDWTSASITAGGFFLGSNLTIAANGSTALTANTLTSISLLATFSSSLNNIIVIFWTDTTQAQNVTLDFGNVQLERGIKATPFERRPFGTEFALCQRYYQKTYGINTAPGTATVNGYRYQGVGANVTGQLAMTWPFAQEMRVAPTMTIYSPTAGSSGNIDRGGTAVAGFAVSVSTTSALIGTNDATSASNYGFQAVAVAEL